MLMGAKASDPTPTAFLNLEHSIFECLIPPGSQAHPRVYQLKNNIDGTRGLTRSLTG